MSIHDDTRDKVVALEVKVLHLTQTIESMDEKLTEVHSLFLQAKGARWAIVGAATVGGFIAAKAAAWLPWIASLPPK